MLNGQHDVWRYDVMWVILGLAQLMVVPLMAFGYPVHPGSTDDGLEPS